MSHHRDVTNQLLSFVPSSENEAGLGECLIRSISAAALYINRPNPIKIDINSKHEHLNVSID